jgi:hypothetical protein
MKYWEIIADKLSANGWTWAIERASGAGSDVAVIAGQFASTNGGRFVKKQPAIKQDLNRAQAVSLPVAPLPFQVCSSND